MVASARADEHFDPFASMHGQPPKHKRVYEGLGPDSLTAEEIQKYAAPALDPVVSRRIQAMLDVRAADGGAVIGDRGDRQFFGWKVTGVSQVWRQDGAMKYPVQLT